MKLWGMRSVLAVLLCAVSVAASSYRVNVPSDLIAGSTLLKKGDYVVTIESRVALLKKGAEVFRISAVIDKDTHKFRDTELEIEDGRIKAIDLGGTDMKIVFLQPR